MSSPQKKSITKRSTNAVYKCKDNKSMSGMRVKLAFTLSAIGTCMPLVCTVTGLTQREDDKCRVLPSHLLSNDSWVRLVVDLLDMENMNVTTNITQPQKDKADHLVKILQNRLISILFDKSKTKSNVLNGV